MFGIALALALLGLGPSALADVYIRYPVPGGTTPYRVSSLFGPRLLNGQFDYHEAVDFSAHRDPNTLAELEGLPRENDPVYAMDGGSLTQLDVLPKPRGLLVLKVQGTGPPAFRYLHMFPQAGTVQFFTPGSTIYDVDVTITISGEPIVFRLTRRVMRIDPVDGRVVDGRPAIVMFAPGSSLAASIYHSESPDPIYVTDQAGKALRGPSPESTTRFAADVVCAGAVIGPVGGSGGYPSHLHIDVPIGNKIYSPLPYLQHEEGAPFRYAAQILRPVPLSSLGNPIPAMGPVWVVDPKETEIWLGVSYTQTGDLDRVEMYLSRSDTGAVNLIDRFRYGGTTRYNASDNTRTLATAGLAFTSSVGGGVLPRTPDYSAPQGPGTQEGWMVFVTRRWYSSVGSIGGAGNLRQLAKRLPEGGRDKVLVGLFSVSGGSTVYEFPFILKPSRPPFVRRVVVGSASQYEGVWMQRTGPVSATTLDLKFSVVSNTPLKDGSHPITVEFSRPVVSATLTLEGGPGISGHLFPVSVASTVWRGSISIPLGTKGRTEKVQLAIRGRDEYGITLALVSKSTGELNELVLAETPTREATDTRHEVTVNVVVPDDAVADRKPDPSNPSSRFAKPPTDPKDLLKNGSNKDRLLGYMPHRPIFPGGLKDLHDGFAGFSSFRGLDWKLCNTSDAAGKAPQEQKASIVATIEGQRTSMDTEYGPNAPERIKKVKLLSYAEEGIGAVGAVTDKASNAGNHVSSLVLNGTPLKFSATLGMPTQVVEQMMVTYKDVAASYSAMLGVLSAVEASYGNAATAGGGVRHLHLTFS